MVEGDRILTLLAERTNNNERLLWRGRHLDTRMMLRIDETEYLVNILKGRVVSVGRGPFVLPSWQFSLSSDEQSWTEFWQPTPKPGYNDLLALLKRKRLRIEGDMHPFMSHLMYFKELLSSLRLSEGES